MPDIFHRRIQQPPEGDSPPLSARVRRGAVWSILYTLILRFANTVIIAIVAHILTRHDFGVFAVAMTAYQIVFALGTLGAGACLLRADLNTDSLAPTMVTVSLVMSVTIAGAMAAFATHIAAALGSVDAAAAVRVMALAMLLEGLVVVPWAELTRDFKQDKIFLANAIAFVPSTAALLVLAKSGGGALAFAWSKVINQFIMDCVMVMSVPKIYPPGLSRGALSTLIKFGFPIAGTGFISYILVNVDNAFIGHLIGPVSLGIYVLAYNIAGWPGSLVGPLLRNLAIPAFSRVKHDPDRLKNAMTRALRVVSVIILPTCSLLMALARPLVVTVYGAKWAASAEVLSILSLYTALSAICSLLGYMLAGLGKANTNLAISLVWLGLLIPAMALGVQLNGIVGAAIAHIALVGAGILPISIFALRRVTGAHFARLGKAVLPSLLAASAAALAAKGAASQFASPLVQLIAGLAAGSLVYGVTAAPECAAFLSQNQSAKLRALRLFRLYTVAVHIAGLPVGGGPVHWRKTGRHRRNTDAT